MRRMAESQGQKQGWRMHQSRKRSLASAIAVALALCASQTLAAVQSHGIPDSRPNNASVPPPALTNFRAPVAAAALGDGTRIAISRAWAETVTLCTRTLLAAAPSFTTTDFCFDSESVPPRDSSNGSPLVSASAPASDSTWLVISPVSTAAAVALFAPAASAGAPSPAKPDLRPDHPPVPPPVRNIWAPVSASAPGGSGTWTLTSATWTDANGDARAAMSPQPGPAIFQGVPGTVTVDNSAGAISVTGMQFAIDDYTLTGGALNLVDSDGNAPIIEVGDGDTGGAGYEAVINNVLIGDGLIKTGAGTLVLSGSNDIVGTTEINGGTLSLVGNGSIANFNSAYSIQIDDNGTLDISGATNGAAIRSFWGSGSIVLGNKTLTVNGYSSFGGVISGSGGLTVSSGFLTLVGANTYTGLTTVDQGAQLQLGSVYTGSVAGAILNHGTLSFFFDNANLTYGGVISGIGSVDKSGTGKLTLTGTNTFTGGLMVTGVSGDSVLAVSSDSNLGASTGGVDLQGGTLEATASFTLNHQLGLISNPARGTSAVQVDSDATLTVANGISGESSESLIKTGPGTLILAAMN